MAVPDRLPPNYTDLKAALAHGGSASVRLAAAIEVGRALERAAGQFVYVPGGCMDALATALREDRSVAVRAAAAAGFGSLPHREQLVADHADAVTALIPALQDRSPKVRLAAVVSLGRLIDKRAARPLRALLETNPSGRLHDATAIALGFCGGLDAAEPLRALLARDPKPSVTLQAVWSLAGCGGARAVEPLVAALSHRDEQVRSAAVICLGVFAEKRVGHSHHADQRVRVMTGFEHSLCWGLYHPPKLWRGPPPLALLRKHAVVPLQACLQDPYNLVRGYAAEALGFLADPRSAGPLTEAIKAGRAGHEASIALGNLADRSAVEPLLAILKDGDEPVREHAVDALGLLRDPRAVGPLLAVWKGGHVEPSLRNAVAFALLLIGDPQAESMARAAIDAVDRRDDGDDDRHWHWVNALAHRGDAHARRLMELSRAYDKD